MSKIKLEGNASGTGTLTISAPNTNTDRSLTLPDSAGEVLITDGTITIDDTNDRVGIGTSSPSTDLDIEGFRPRIEIKNTDTSGGTYRFVVGDASDANYLAVYDTGASQERMRIDSSGDFLFADTGSNSVGIPALQVGGSGGNALLTVRRNSTASVSQVFFYNPNGIVGTITTSGSATSYNTSSDYRLKENVVPMTGSIDRLKALNPSRFNFIADPDKTVDGFLAHEAQEVVPEAVTGTKDAMRTEEYEVTPAVKDDDGNVVTEAVMGEREVEDYQGIDQSKLVPLLTGALQEAIAKIEELETRIETLENA